MIRCVLGEYEVVRERAEPIGRDEAGRGRGGPGAGRLPSGQAGRGWVADALPYQRPPGRNGHPGPDGLPSSTRGRIASSR